MGSVITGNGRDIDLAIVGLTYESCWDDEKFVKEVSDFFESFKAQYSLAGSRKRDMYSCGGSGPFAGTYIEVELVGPHNSRGFQSVTEGCRPIDLQFVFNESPERWKYNQEYEPYPYAILFGR